MVLLYLHRAVKGFMHTGSPADRTGTAKIEERNDFEDSALSGKESLKKQYVC